MLDDENMCNMVADQFVHLAQQALATNIECYIAQWVIQNPDANIGDYEVVYQSVVGGHTISINKKELK